LQERALEELHELFAAIVEERPAHEVLDEAADVANFVAMIAENYRAEHGGDDERPV